MIDDYNFDSQIGFLEYAIESIGLSDNDYLFEANIDIRGKAKEIATNITTLFGKLKDYILRFINKFRKKVNAQEVVLNAEEKSPK